MYKERASSSGNDSGELVGEIVFVLAMLKTKAACGVIQGRNKDKTT